MREVRKFLWGQSVKYEIFGRTVLAACRATPGPETIPTLDRGVFTDATRFLQNLDSLHGRRVSKLWFVVRSAVVPLSWRI
jgi:hypothetical protein